MLCVPRLGTQNDSQQSITQGYKGQQKSVILWQEKTHTALIGYMYYLERFGFCLKNHIQLT